MIYKVICGYHFDDETEIYRSLSRLNIDADGVWLEDMLHPSDRLIKKMADSLGLQLLIGKIVSDECSDLIIPEPKVSDATK